MRRRHPASGAAHLVARYSGKPVINAGDGNDTVNISAVKPMTVNGGAGADTMAGGAGSDTYVVDSLDDVVIEGSGTGNGTADLIETWIEMKSEDINALRQRPHPHEFEMYFDL